jgi:(R,R)-butanediol dehydrogenase/meso-butanediol dehydrogenase/diacetyl reductase
VFEPAAVALHAVRRAGIRPGETVAVLGLGPIGLLVTQLAARYGAGRIVAADRSAARRELALRLGAAETGADLADVVRGEGADVVFEAVGSEDTLRACLAATRRGGRVMFLGLAGTVRLDAFALVNNEQTIMTSVGYRDAYPELIRMVAEEGVDLAGIVTSTIALEHVVRDGFEALLRGEEQVKMLVRPRERRP